MGRPFFPTHDHLNIQTGEWKPVWFIQSISEASALVEDVDGGHWQVGRPMLEKHSAKRYPHLPRFWQDLEMTRLCQEGDPIAVCEYVFGTMPGAVNGTMPLLIRGIPTFGVCASVCTAAEVQPDVVIHSKRKGTDNE